MTPHGLDLRKRVLNGLAWKAGSQIVLQVSRLAVALVLARLLLPSDYGIAAMALVFTSLVIVFADLGLGAALVQRPEISEADRSTVFWTSTAAGAAFTIAGIALSGPIASFYGEPAVQPLVAVVSLSFLITSLGITQSALLNREMNFRALELRMLAGSLVGAVVGIGLAVAGFGAWAIIAQQLALSIVSTVLLWSFSSWKPRFMFSTASLRDLGGFGGNVFGTRVLFAVSRNADNILIGRFLGPGALGIYSLAYNLMLVPFERIAGPLQEVLFPAFSRLQDQRARIGELWLKANRLVAAVTLPATLGLIVLAPEFVDVVLGAKWAPAVPVIRILGWVGFLQSLVRLNSSILEACDRTNLLLRWSILISVANVCAFVGGLHWGVVGVAAGYAITNTALQPVNVWMTGRPVGVSLRSFVLNLAGVVQASVLMALVVLASRELLMAAGASPLLRLCVLPLVGAGIYLPLAAWRAPATFRDLRNLRSGRVAAAPAATMP